MNKPFIIEDGYPFIAVPLVLALLAAYFINLYVAVVPLVLAAYFTYFFRNPHRTIPDDPSLRQTERLLAWNRCMKICF